MTIAEIQNYIGTVENNASLLEEQNFDKRMEVIDFIGFPLTDQLEALRQQATPPGEIRQLEQRIAAVKATLETVDNRLFERLRENIRAGKYSGNEFNTLVREYVHVNSDPNLYSETIGYDNLDLFVNGLSHVLPMPTQTKDLEPGMIFYLKTPARAIFELVEKVPIGKDDVFFDLGSGLGQVTIMVNLLTGATTKGVEFEPAFSDYARDSAAILHLSNVTFLNEDARKTDYSQGTIFFLFTPFSGEILQEVLEMLRQVSLQRKIKVVAFGPCTPYVSMQSWLEFDNPGKDDIYKITVFNSR